MDLATVPALLDKIPESIWGIAIGSALTLFGVALTNRHSLKQQRQQFEFESRERQHERLASLRKDVYLPAADAVTGMIAIMASMIGDEVSQEQMNEGARTLAAALTRIQMVAQSETIKKVSEFQREYLHAFRVLQQHRMPMMLRKTDIRLAADQQQSCHDERMACVQQMKEYNDAGGKDERRFHALRQAAEVWSERWADAHGEWLRLTLAQEEARLNMAREFTVRMTALIKLQAPLLATVRGELETDEASALLAEEAEQTAAVGIQAISDVVPMLERNVEGFRQDVAADEQRRARRAAHER